MQLKADPRNDLRRLEPWLADLRLAAAERGVDVAVLAGLLLRESLATWAPGYAPKGSFMGWGDGSNAFGGFQIDKRFHAAALRGLVAGVDLTTVVGQARYVCQLLVGAAAFLRARHPSAAPELLLRASIAAYNADLFRVDAQLDAGADPDAVTTAGPTGRPDYGADVLARADRLRRADPHFFPPPAG